MKYLIGLAVGLLWALLWMTVAMLIERATGTPWHVTAVTYLLVAEGQAMYERTRDK